MKFNFNVNILSIAIIVVLAFFLLQQCEKAKEASGLLVSISDTLHTETMKNGQQKAVILSMQGENEDLFLQIKTKDTTITHLQKQITDYKGKLAAAVFVQTSTTEAGSTVTTIIDTIEHFPVYFSEWVEEWSSGSITASKDSISRNIKFKSDFEVIIGERRNKIFKKPEMQLQVVSLNPNTTTQAARSFIVKNHQKRLNLGLQAGYGVNMLTFKPVFYVGFGVGFTLVPLK